MSTSMSARWFLLLALAATLALYAKGLDGPFLFDDHIHITQNNWVKIESLGWPDLAQAWNSSFSNFPSDRPLSQLTFGINHALNGLDPWAFKTTNLAIHLATGLIVGYPPCPSLDYFREFIQTKYDIPVVFGTHPIPEKYLQIHQKLGTWDHASWMKLSDQH